MRRWVTARARADEFAAAVDGRAADVAELDEHRAFVELVSQLRDLEAPSLRPDFSSDLRTRLMDEAPSALSAGASGPVGVRRRDSAIVSFPASPRRRTATAAVTACIVLGGTVGVAAASQSALPGETLYPVKRGLEHVQVVFAGSQHAKGSDYLDQASTRLDEVTDLTVAHGDDPATPALVQQALNDFATQAGDGAGALMTSYRDDNDGASITELRVFTNESVQRLDALAVSIPASASEALSDAATLLQELDRAATQLCPGCSSLPTLTLSSALIELSQSTTTGTSSDPAAVAPTQSIDARTGDDRQTGAAKTSSTTAPPGGQTGAGPSVDLPGLPGIPSALEPSAGGPTATATSQPTQSAGGTVSVPGGPAVTVGATVPTVPSVPTASLPTLPNGPLGSVPSVVDSVTNGLDLP